MDEGLFFDTMRQGLWIAVVTSLPILGVALAAGLIVGLFQALTSIQELTLTFVPKLAAIAIVFWMTMGFMTHGIVAFFHEQIIPLIIGA